MRWAAAVVVAVMAAAIIPSTASQQVQLLDASPFFIEAPPPAPSSQEHPIPFQGLPPRPIDVEEAPESPSQVAEIPLDPRPSLDNTEFQEERMDYPEDEAALNPEDLTSVFHDEGDTGESLLPEDFTATSAELLGVFQYADTHDEQTQTPALPREEQHPPPPPSHSAAPHSPSVPDVTPLQEEELQLQPPSRTTHQQEPPHQDQNHHFTQPYDPNHQYPEVEDPRQQLSSPGQFEEETHDVVEVVSAPRPSRSPDPSRLSRPTRPSRPFRPRPYSEIPYQRTVHPNELPVVSEIQVAPGVNERKEVTQVWDYQGEES